MRTSGRGAWKAGGDAGRLRAKNATRESELGVQRTLIIHHAACACAQCGLKIPISVPVNGKSGIFTPPYLINRGDTFRKLMGFGHGAPPRSQIR